MNCPTLLHLSFPAAEHSSRRQGRACPVPIQAPTGEGMTDTELQLPCPTGVMEGSAQPVPAEPRGCHEVGPRHCVVQVHTAAVAVGAR